MEFREELESRSGRLSGTEFREEKCRVEYRVLGEGGGLGGRRKKRDKNHHRMSVMGKKGKRKINREG